MVALLEEVRTAKRFLQPGVARATREASGVTVRRVAEELQVDPSTVWRWEEGRSRPTGEVLLRYLELLVALDNEIAE